IEQSRGFQRNHIVSPSNWNRPYGKCQNCQNKAQPSITSQDVHPRAYKRCAPTKQEDAGKMTQPECRTTLKSVNDETKLRYGCRVFAALSVSPCLAKARSGLSASACSKAAMARSC